MIRGSAAVPGRKWCTAVAAAAVVAFTISGKVGAQGPISVSGNPATMRITTAVAGAQPNSVIDASTTYSSDGKQNNRHIVAQLNAPMPTGVTLMVTLDVPAGATSVPNVVLGTTAQTVAINIDQVKKGFTNQITYTLSATPAAGVVPLQSRQVTLTLIAMP
jgi:hypothetical protein